MQRITHNYVSRADQRAALVINQTIDLSTFPETYWMEAVGDCLLPMVKDGTNLLFSQSAKPVAGDLVALFLRPEFKAPGVMPALVKRLVSNIAHFCEFPYTPRSDDDCAPIVICESTSPLRRYYVPAERLMAVHKCIAVEEPIT